MDANKNHCLSAFICVHLRLNQNRTRSEIWRILGSPALEIFPKVEVLATLEPGALKCGLFRRLKKSPRSWVENRSVMRNDFATDQSRLKKPGARRTLRGLVPNVPGAAAWNAAVLNQAFRSCERG